MFHMINDDQPTPPICPTCLAYKVYTLHGWQCVSRKCIMARIADGTVKASELPEGAGLYKVVKDQMDSDDWENDDE